MARQYTQTKETQDDVTFVVTELVGEHAMKIINFLKGKEKISEFIIAEELETEINEVRHILYKLFEHNVVSFIRKKDRIKGWYICYWDFHAERIPTLKYKILMGKLEKLKLRLTEEESAQFYICPRACTRVTFDEAMEQSFKCQECGGIFQEQDNTRTREFLQTRIAELEDQVKKARPKNIKRIVA